jgi:hypothetical protein
MFRSPFWAAISSAYLTLAMIALSMVCFAEVIAFAVSGLPIGGNMAALWVWAVGYFLVFALWCLTCWRRIAPGRKSDGLACLVCGYDLRGLEHTDRCPECGELYDAEESRSFFSSGIIPWLYDPRRQHWPSGQRWPGGIVGVLWCRGRSSASMPGASGQKPDAPKREE